MSRTYKIAVVDTETTGLDPETSDVIELAFAVGEFTPDGLTLIEAASIMLPCETNEAEPINGIPAELSRKGFLTLETVADSLVDVECFIAHNAKFDKAFCDKLFRTIHDCDTEWHLLGTPWVCTFEDYVWENKGKRLTHLAADLGIFTTAGKHRALVDVMLLWEVIASQGFDAFEAAYERSKLPRWEARAMVSYDGREMAKAAGFQWNPDRKSWLKEVRAAKREEIKFDFPVHVSSLPAVQQVLFRDESPEAEVAEEFAREKLLGS